MNETAFQFAETVSARHTATRLAERLQYYAPERVLSGPYRLGEFDPTPLSSAFEALKPDNALVLLVHPDADTDTESEYYSTPYSVTPLSGNTVASWRSPAPDSDLAIPEPNPFVPTNLQVSPLEREESSLFSYTPQLITDSDALTVWFEQDDEFRTPKSDIHLLLQTDLLNNDVTKYAALLLYLDLVDDALNEIRYQASLAGSGYGVNITNEGIQVRLYGYQDKLPLLLDTLILELTEHEFTAERFAILRDDLLRKLRNRDEDPVVNQVLRHINERLVSNIFDNEQQIDAVEQLTIEKLIKARNELFASSQLKLLLHGNLTLAQARALAERIDAVIPQTGEGAEKRQIARLPNRQYLTRMSIDHSDSAFLQYHQGADASLRERALYSLLAETLSAPYFAEMRTKEQLGYIVLARPYPIDGWPGLILYIQSPSTDPALLQRYSDRFLKRFTQDISDMSNARFNAYKNGLANTLTEPDKNLYQLSGRYWRNILDGNPHYNTRSRIADEVSKISLDGFRRFFENKILGDEASSLTLHQIGAQMSEDYDEHIPGIVGYYPVDGSKTWPEDVQWTTPRFNDLPER